jgi:hypothetical protein
MPVRTMQAVVDITAESGTRDVVITDTELYNGGFTMAEWACPDDVQQVLSGTAAEGLGGDSFDLRVEVFTVLAGKTPEFVGREF